MKEEEIIIMAKRKGLFVQSVATINHAHKNGLLFHTRRGGQESLVQWQNGRQEWVMTADLRGNVRALLDNI